MRRRVFTNTRLNVAHAKYFGAHPNRPLLFRGCVVRVSRRGRASTNRREASTVRAPGPSAFFFGLPVGNGGQPRRVGCAGAGLEIGLVRRGRIVAAMTRRNRGGCSPFVEGARSRPAIRSVWGVRGHGMNGPVRVVLTSAPDPGCQLLRAGRSATALEGARYPAETRATNRGVCHVLAPDRLIDCQQDADGFVARPGASGEQVASRARPPGPPAGVASGHRGAHWGANPPATEAGDVSWAHPPQDGRRTGVHGRPGPDVTSFCPGLCRFSWADLGVGAFRKPRRPRIGDHRREGGRFFRAVVWHHPESVVGPPTMGDDDADPAWDPGSAPRSHRAERDGERVRHATRDLLRN